MGLYRVIGSEASFNQSGGNGVYRGKWSFPCEQGASTPQLPGDCSGCSRLGGIPFFRDAVQIHISSMKDSCPLQTSPHFRVGW